VSTARSLSSAALRADALAPQPALQALPLIGFGINARYKSLILPNLDSKRSRQEFPRLFDCVFVADGTYSLTAVDMSGVLHEDAVGFFHRPSDFFIPPRKTF